MTTTISITFTDSEIFALKMSLLNSIVTNEILLKNDSEAPRVGDTLVAIWKSELEKNNALLALVNDAERKSIRGES